VPTAELKWGVDRFWKVIFQQQQSTHANMEISYAPTSYPVIVTIFLKKVCHGPLKILSAGILIFPFVGNRNNESI
jgi:hypothetical protein